MGKKENKKMEEELKEKFSIALGGLISDIKNIGMTKDVKRKLEILLQIIGVDETWEKLPKDIQRKILSIRDAIEIGGKK